MTLQKQRMRGQKLFLESNRILNVVITALLLEGGYQANN